MNPNAFRDEEWENTVRQNTWGHLFPKDGYYEGKIFVAHGEYGDIIIVKEDIDVPGSPWWFQEINDFVDTLDYIKEGTVYEVAISVKVDSDTGDITINRLASRQVL